MNEGDSLPTGNTVKLKILVNVQNYALLHIFHSLMVGRTRLGRFWTPGLIFSTPGLMQSNPQLFSFTCIHTVRPINIWTIREFL